MPLLYGFVATILGSGSATIRHDITAHNLSMLVSTDFPTEFNHDAVIKSSQLASAALALEL